MCPNRKGLNQRTEKTQLANLPDTRLLTSLQHLVVFNIEHWLNVIAVVTKTVSNINFPQNHRSHYPLMKNLKNIFWNFLFCLPSIAAVPPCALSSLERKSHSCNNNNNNNNNGLFTVLQQNRSSYNYKCYVHYQKQETRGHCNGSVA